MKNPSLSFLSKTSRPAIVGILNVTPDSFSDGGNFIDPQIAIQKASELIADGADLVECGAESTAPGSSPLSADVEIARLEPVLKLLAGKIPFAVDTYKARVAELALTYGAVLINDTSALRADPEMGTVISKSSAAVVLMFAKDSPLPHVTAAPGPSADKIIEILRNFFKERITVAKGCGIAPNRIILDTGMGGFISKEPHSSFEILKRYAAITAEFSEYEFLIGTSRKGFLGKTKNVESRDALSQLTALTATQRGASFVRTHNVAQAKMFINCAANCF